MSSLPLLLDSISSITLAFLFVSTEADCEVTAVFHHLAPRAKVVGIDHIKGLVDQSIVNLKKDGVELGAVEGGVHIICGDGRLGELTCYCPGTLPLRSGSPENGGSFEGCAGLAYV